nr:MAG: capsid protein [Cressdnaviricota sp.]
MKAVTRHRYVSRLGYAAAVMSAAKSRFGNSRPRRGRGVKPRTKGRKVTKKPASRTRTRTKRKSKTVTSDAGNSGKQSYTFFAFGPKKAAGMKKMSAPIVYGTTNAWTYDSANGGQNTFAADTCLAADLQTLATIAENQNRALVNLSATSVPLQQSRLFLKNVFAEYTCSNASEGPMILDIYDYKYLRDESSTTNLVQYLLTPLPTDNTNAIPADTYGCTVPGWEPTDNGMIPTVCHIVKRIRVFLAPGEMHVHKTYAQFNKIQLQDSTAGAGVNAMKGFSHGTIFKWRGTVGTGFVSGNDLIGSRLRVYKTTRYKFNLCAFGIPHQETYSYAKINNPIVGAVENINPDIAEVFEAGVGILNGQMFA